MRALNPHVVGLCRARKAEGYKYDYIARQLNLTKAEVYFNCTGKKYVYREGGKTLAEHMADEMANVPHDRCPNEHRKIVLANFGDAA